MSGNPMNSIKEAYACILAFNVPILPDAERLAKEIGIPIYTAEIIYHLFDAFTKRVNDIKAKKKEEARKKAVYPVVFKIVDERCVFNKKDPYILGVDVLEGELKLGTPVVIPDVKWTGNAQTQEPAKELLEFGQVARIPFAPVPRKLSQRSLRFAPRQAAPPCASDFGAAQRFASDHGELPVLTWRGGCGR